MDWNFSRERAGYEDGREFRMGRDLASGASIGPLNRSQVCSNRGRD